MVEAVVTFVDRLVRAASTAGNSRGITFVGAKDPVFVGFAQLTDEAKAMAAALQVRGIGPGHQVAILGPTSRPLVTAIEATWLSGAATVVLPLPMRLGSLDEFVSQTRSRIVNADASIVLVDPDLAAFIVSEPGDPPMVTFDDLTSGASAMAPKDWVMPDLSEDDLAILQFTSGSTSEPKGVMIPHRQFCNNVDAIARGAGLTVDDCGVSWLPLYHDMGLIGLLSSPLAMGCNLVLGAPQDFLASPGRWMQWISDYRGTHTAGPNFSYVLAARALGRGEPLDLSSLRVALNGAEPVDPSTVNAFIAAGERHQLSPGAVFPGFGMAEATLAVNFPAVGAGIDVDVVDLRVLETDRYAAPSTADAPNARAFTRLGTPVDGMEIRIANPEDQRVMGDREVGELQIRGTSVTPGYFRRPDATAALFTPDGWMRTGDLGYLIDGELVVCGRMKDVIIIGGRNVWPEDIERAVGQIAGVRPGNVIAFGIEGRKGKEAVVVVAEARLADSDGGAGLDDVRGAVAERVRLSVGIPAAEVILVSPGSLPKTSSGKLQRSLCRTRYLSDELELV
jgi:fatty-acyl-CoA synthase